nr:hypothetical protein [Deltaproteobacteria bacterium]
MALQTCMYFNAAPIEADIVHCHTWYSMWGGILAKIAYGIPLVATVHSLEPMRPWKREQLGRGYDLSSWVERTALEMADAVIADSSSDREQILLRFAVNPEKISVIPNGVDTQVYRPVRTTAFLDRYGIDTERPYVLFLGMVSRQKGIDHFLIGAYLMAVEKLGRRTAGFHRALCPKGGDRAFRPEPMRSEDVEAMAESFVRKARHSMELLSYRIHELNEDSRVLADKVLTAASLLINRFRDPAQLRSRPARIRCHGDYHLGQVLWTGNDFVLLDFEGEPLKTLEERRQKHSALKDVAGMLRSFSYAAQTKRGKFVLRAAEDREILEQWFLLWERWVTTAFVQSYLAEAGREPFVPGNFKDIQLLLQAFVLDKAFYELTYELNNRPDWVYIPLKGILLLVGDV